MALDVSGPYRAAFDTVLPGSVWSLLHSSSSRRNSRLDECRPPVQNDTYGINIRLAPALHAPTVHVPNIDIPHLRSRRARCLRCRRSGRTLQGGARTAYTPGAGRCARAKGVWMGRNRMRKARVSICLLVVAALVAASCGGDDDAESSSTTTASTVSGSAAPSTGGSSPAAGEPLKILQITIEDPALGISLESMRNGLKARIDRLNEEGGIAGRPVEIDVCAAGQDPNKADDCARRAVDGRYLAAAGGLFTQNSNFVKILADANIPVIGYQALTPPDVKSPNSFPIGGGGTTLAVGAVAALVDEGITDIAVASVDVASAGEAVTVMQAYLSKKGLPAATIVPVQRGKADLSGEAQRLSDHDGVVLQLGNAEFVQLVTLLQDTGFDKSHVSINMGLLTAASAKALGNEPVEGFRGVNSFAPRDMAKEAYDQVDEDYAALSSKAPLDQLAIDAWAAGDLLAVAGADITDPTGPQMLAAVQGVRDFTAHGLIAPLDLSTPGPLQDQPSLRNTKVVFGVIKDGAMSAPDGEFVDVYAS